MSQISSIGRNTQGVRLINLQPGDKLVGAAKIIIEKCIKDKVKHFIFASSGSVYGLKKEKKVTEDLLKTDTKRIVAQLRNNVLELKARIKPGAK